MRGDEMMSLVISTAETMAGRPALSVEARIGVMTTRSLACLSLGLTPISPRPIVWRHISEPSDGTPRRCKVGKALDFVPHLTLHFGAFIQSLCCFLGLLAPCLACSGTTIHERRSHC